MKIKITLTEEMLGTACANADVHREFIALKSPDAEKVEEELAALPADEAMQKSMTVFPRNADGAPVLWDYQVKGFFKGVCNALRETPESVTKTDKRLSKYSHKRTLDLLLFVRPRQIVLNLPEGATVGKCTRPLRAETMRGERVALATSETVPAGTWFEVEVKCLDPKLEKYVAEALAYGEYLGIGQWRNSGKGRFSFEVIG